VPRLTLLWLLFVSTTLGAQTPASVARAASTIRAEDVRRRIGVLADDSMRGRDTPSPELEKVASWIAAEFRAFGLRPGVAGGSYLQRYTIVRKQVDTAQTVLTVSHAPGPSVTLKLGADLNVLQLGPPLPSRDVSGPVVLLSGPADAANPLAGADVRGSWIAVLASGGPRGMSLDIQAAQAALTAGAVGLLVISDRSEDQLRAIAKAGYPPALTLGDDSGPDPGRIPALVEIREHPAARVLAIEPAVLRAESVRRARRLGGITVTFHVQQRILSTASAPNVIGILEGSDPLLKNEYVFFTAHMDHLGVASPQNPACRAQGEDPICNGADDDASGTTAVIENAAAFARLVPRPKRSLVFMTVSGEEKGLWGSQYFTSHPTVPLDAIVADLNTDMVGRNWKDTIAVIGKEQSDLGATLDRVAAEHPELHLTPIGDMWPSENFYFRSDHYNFARTGVPILFFFNGTHADYHQVSDEVSKIDAEKESRIIRLVFYLGLEIANAGERPRWDPAAYRRVVEGEN
jgi:hypothetical protein